MATTDDLANYRAQITDLLIAGNKMYTETGNNGVLKQVLERKKALEDEEKSLTEQITRAAAIIEKNNQDFYDVKQTLPEKLPVNNRLHTVEDYTLGFLSISYLFMMTMLVYLYVLFAENRWAAFGRASMMSILFTLLMALLLYYFA